MWSFNIEIIKIKKMYIQCRIVQRFLDKIKIWILLYKGVNNK